MAAGAAWGAAGVWLFPDHDVLHWMFLIFVLAGVTTGGVVSYSADRFSAIAFSILPVVPLIIRLFAAGDSLSAEMGVAVTLYMGFMLTNLLHITRNVYQGIFLRHEAAVSEEKMRASERHLKQAQSIANIGSWKLDFVPASSFETFSGAEHAVDGSFIRGKRFIVVEDDALVAQAMVSVLEDMGGEVKCFHAAEEALHHEDMEHAHYIISDYMLGGADSTASSSSTSSARNSTGRSMRY